jgi:hypothetical protein
MRMAYNVLYVGVFAVVAYGILRLSRNRKKMEEVMQPILSADEVSALLEAIA